MQQVKTIRGLVYFLVIAAVVFFQACGNLYANVEQEVIARSISHYIMGLVHDMYGSTQDAIEEYKKAAAYDKENYILRLRLGADYAHLGKLEEAIKALKLAKEYNPDDLQASYLLALIYSTQQEFIKAADEYESILQHFSQVDPQNLDVYNYLGQLYYSQRRFKKAIAQFQRILAFEPKNADILSVIGSLHLELGERKKAVEFFKKTLEIDPDHGVSLNSLGYLYAEDDVKLDEAQELIERALLLEPDNGAYLDSLGWVYFKKGMYLKALDYLDKAISIFKDPIIYEHIGDVYYALRQNDQAKKYWNLSLELLPGQEHVLEKLDGIKQE